MKGGITMAYDEFYDIYDKADEPSDWWDREVEPHGDNAETSTIWSWENPKMKIVINPNRDLVGNPYFKVFNTESYYYGVTKVVRLSFIDSRIIYHRDRFKDWNIDDNDIAQIKEVLNWRHEFFKDYTVWQITKWAWNFEYFALLKSDLVKYMTGKLDKQYKDHPSYVPSDTPMPETWK